MFQQFLLLFLTKLLNGDESFPGIYRSEKSYFVQQNNLRVPLPALARYSQTHRGIIRTSTSLRTRLTPLYKECKTKGCFTMPQGCAEKFLSSPSSSSQPCQIFLSWEVDGDGRNLFKLIGRLPGSGQNSSGYVAMGISDDENMGKDSVVGCYISNGFPAISRFYNTPDYTNRVASDSFLGLKPLSKGIEEDHIFCEFEQFNHTLNDLEVNFRTGRYHYILARGDKVLKDGLGPHLPDNRMASIQAIRSVRIKTLFGVQ